MTCQSASRLGLDSPALPARIAPPPSLPRSPRSTLIAAIALMALITAIAGGPAAAQSLYGSHESLVRQNLVAQQHDYAYLRTPQEVAQAVESGVLVAVHGNADYQLADGEVSFRYARPQVKTFLEQLAGAYHAACGEPLVVTSLVRPISRQPWNASPISVHPTGMAIDMRRSDRRGCRQWLESTLLALEGEGMIEATRERWPPHYHVAVFPDPLLLPGPIGDPNGVVRVAALATLHGGPVADSETTFASSADYEPIARHARVHLGRSARTGRYRITQTAVARHGRRGRAASAASEASATSAANGSIDVHRSRRGARHGQQARDSRQGRDPQAAGASRSGTVANARLAAKHRSATHLRSRAHSRAASRATTSAAR
jgi:Family of unknown function (DUF5715)